MKAVPVKMYLERYHPKDDSRMSLVVDGVDLSQSVTDIRIHAGSNEFTTIDLTLYAKVEMEGEARVAVYQPTLMRSQAAPLLGTWGRVKSMFGMQGG